MENSSKLFNNFLRQLNDLDSSAQDWVSFEAFIEQARQVAAEKAVERYRKEKYAPLDQAIADFGQQFLPLTSLASVFQRDSYLQWSSASCTVDQVGSFCQALQEITQLCTPLIEQENRFRELTISERRALLHQEEAFLELYDRLDARFNAPPGQDSPPLLPPMDDVETTRPGETVQSGRPEVPSAENLSAQPSNFPTPSDTPVAQASNEVKAAEVAEEVKAVVKEEGNDGNDDDDSDGDDDDDDEEDEVSPESEAVFSFLKELWNSQSDDEPKKLHSPRPNHSKPSPLSESPSQGQLAAGDGKAEADLTPLAGPPISVNEVEGAITTGPMEGTRAVDISSALVTESQAGTPASAVAVSEFQAIDAIKEMEKKPETEGHPSPKTALATPDQIPNAPLHEETSTNVIVRGHGEFSGPASTTPDSAEADEEEEEFSDSEIDVPVQDIKASSPGEEITWDEEETAVPYQPLTTDEANQVALSQAAGGKWSAAYWIWWALEQKNEVPALPSRLAAAVQGSSWMAALWPAQPASFAEGIRDFIQPEGTDLQGDAAKTLGLSAALYLSLSDGHPGWANWLHTSFPDFNALSELAMIVEDYVSRSFQLISEEVLHIQGTEEGEQKIRQVTESARDWLARAQKRPAKIVSANIVFKDFIQPPDGELFAWLGPVAEDNRSKARFVHEKVRQWRERSWLVHRIHTRDQELSKHKYRPIVGEALNQLVFWIHEACDIADQWALTVMSMQSFAKDSETRWMAEQTNMFFNQAQSLLPKAMEELGQRRQVAEFQVNFDNIAWNTLETMLRWLAQALRIQGSGEKVCFEAPPFSSLNRESSANASLSLEENLAFFLFRFPEVQLSQSWLPRKEDLDLLIHLITTCPQRPDEVIIEQWIRSHDYRFLPMILQFSPARSFWEPRCQEAFAKDRDRLIEQYIYSVNISLEQALAEGMLAEGEYNQLNAQIESARKQVRRAEWSDQGAPNFSLNIRQMKDIHHRLESRRRARLVNQQKHWEEIRQKLNQLGGDDHELIPYIEAAVNKSMEQQDLRAVGEYLSHLEDVLDGSRQQIAAHLFVAREQKDSLLEFNSGLPDMIRALSNTNSLRLLDLVQSDAAIPGLPNRILPVSRRTESVAAIEAWRKLKHDGENARHGNIQHILTLMKFLGFKIVGQNPVSLEGQPGGNRNFQRWAIHASPEPFSPIPQFGSQRKNMFHILGVWNRQGFDLIASQLQSTGSQPTIIFYFGRLLPRQREDLLSTSHRQQLPVIVLDEALLLFLTREYNVRLRTFFNCTLPYSSINPYVPFAAGSVPPEMFVGREIERKKLLDPSGPSIVYGGRQLGKSALLTQVYNDFHQPENGQFAILEDIKPLGDPTTGLDYEAVLRDRLLTKLQTMGVFESKRTPSFTLEKLLDTLLVRLNERNWKLLLLLDEVDNFLEADSLKNFIVVSLLKRVMDQTDRRFRFVFAGLHNVERFQRISNQPLAHLGRAVEIGPLAPEHARELLERPLHALGYRFGENIYHEDPSLILHILSYTNYHPGLIQLFGYYLVEHMQNKNQNQRIQRPPIPITRRDVEQVYKKEEVRSSIRERFNWTLVLDDRYEAITLAIILDQIQAENGFDVLYTAKDLYNKVVSWWPKGFEDDFNTGRFLGLLEEMRGLGVLTMVQDEGNRYRLRSPNLVHLMGTADELMDRMEAISHKEFTTRRILESQHAQINEVPSYSPLTFAQEQTINSPRSGVVMIFGAEATNFPSLSQASQRFVAGNTHHWQEIRIANKSGAAIYQQLDKFTQENPQAGLLVAFRDLDGTMEEMYEQVSTASRFCRTKTRHTLRVLFALNGQTAWQWFQLQKANREALEQKGIDAVISLSKWSAIGVKQRMSIHKQQIIASDRNIQKIMEVTGGWPQLLDQFLETCSTDDPLPALEKFRQQLYSPGSAMRDDFIRSLGLVDPLPRKVLHALLKEGAQELFQTASQEEVLPLLLENEKVEDAIIALEYMQRMSILEQVPYLTIDPVVARLWNDPSI